MPKMTAIFSTAFLSLGLLAGVAHAQGPAESSPPQAAGMAASAGSRWQRKGDIRKAPGASIPGAISPGWVWPCAIRSSVAQT